MKNQFLPLLLVAVGTGAIAQTPSNGVSATPGATIHSTVPASGALGGYTYRNPQVDGVGLGSADGTASPYPATPSEIVTPSTPSPPGGPVSLASIQARFARLDTNHNGFLSPEEVDLISRSDTISSSAVRFHRMDTNHDGKISAAEYSAVQSALEAGAMAANPLSAAPADAASRAAPAAAPPPAQP